MSLLLQAIVALEAEIGALPRRLKLPAPSESEKLLALLGAAEAAPRAPDGLVLEALRARLAAVFSTTGSGADAAPRDLRMAAWVLWNGTPPAATFPGLLDAVERQAASSPRTLRFLMEAWIRDFNPDAPDMAVAGLAIRRLLSQSQSERFEAWRAADQRFQLLAAVQGPRLLAQKLVTGSDPVVDLLAAASFNDPPRAISGYLRAVQSQALASCAEAFRSRDGKTCAARVCAFLAHEDALRFDENRIDAARGLLRAWLDGGAKPAPEIGDVAATFLVRHVGDPRLRPGRWVGAEEEAALVRRWLARESLEVFFALIAQHALDAQWRFRKAFWLACLNKGAIDDARLALGANVYNSARAKKLGESCAQLVGSGLTGDQSVLLMRVGPLVLCEWSHNGKLRGWPAEWKSAPKLSQQYYGRDGLVTNGLPFPPNPRTGSRGVQDGSGLMHLGSVNDRWQGSVAELLARRADLHLQRADWRPK